MFLDALQQLEARIAAVRLRRLGSGLSRCRNAAVNVIIIGSSPRGPGDVEPAVRVLPRALPHFRMYYDAGDVQDVWPDAMAEFFMDWLMRKVMVKLPEYAVAPRPPALLSLLSEKGYLDDPEPIMAGSLRLNRTSLRWCNSDPEGRRPCRLMVRR